MQSSRVVRRADGANTSSAKLGEDLTPAQNGVAAEAPGKDHELNNTSRQRQISHTAAVMAVHPPGNRAARRTQTETPRRADRDNGPITIMVSTFDNKPTRHQTGAAKRLLHGADSLGKSTTRILNFIKFESEPILQAD